MFRGEHFLLSESSKYIIVVFFYLKKLFSDLTTHIDHLFFSFKLAALLYHTVLFNFRSYYSVQVTEWQAYPRYSSSQRLPPVELHPNLYYLNGIEWAGSAMEMSSVAAKNIALLAYHRWNRQTDMVDQRDLVHRIKTEL